MRRDLDIYDVAERFTSSSTICSPALRDTIIEESQSDMELLYSFTARTLVGVAIEI